MSSECHAIQQSDEMYCARCALRWDVNDPAPPECRPVKAEIVSEDRKKLEAVAKGYHDLIALQQKQRDTTAKMIRACVSRLKSPDSRKRAEAIKALDELAAMMEGKA